MSKNKKRNPPPAPVTPQPRIPRATEEEHVQPFLSSSLFTWILILSALTIGGILSWWLIRGGRLVQLQAVVSPTNRASTSPTTNLNNGGYSVTTNFSVMEVAQAVMVTTELDFGPQVPSIADALKQIERRYEPADGVGRTFAILDAYGETTPEGKLHISMHVSTEKPGKAALVFKRTGAVLWESKIVPATKPAHFSGKDLLILVDNGPGKLWTIDGSNNPATILDANVKEAGIPLRDLWFDQTEREITFMFSACGCPVKVQTRRDGDRTVRVKDQPVIFPDDPAVVGVIQKVMAW